MDHACLMRGLRCAGLAAAVFAAAASGVAANDSEFPFDSELLLDARPMRGSERLPSMEIGPDGQASIDLWCNSVRGQFIVVANTVTILTGPPTARQCSPERLHADEEMLSALTQVTNWQRRGDIVTFEAAGMRALRFRMPTN